MVYACSAPEHYTDPGDTYFKLCFLLTNVYVQAIKRTQFCDRVILFTRFVHSDDQRPYERVRKK